MRGSDLRTGGSRSARVERLEADEGFDQMMIEA
jgi:hypothetical protein